MSKNVKADEAKAPVSEQKQVANPADKREVARKPGVVTLPKGFRVTTN